MNDFRNYFNYFTEVEEYFQRTRGTGLFLLSPLDWALIETWKNSGVPLEAVFRGIEVAFENWRARRIRTQQVNSLAFCAQAVLREAQRRAETPPEGQPQQDSPSRQQDTASHSAIRAYLARNAAALRDRQGFDEIAQSLEGLAKEAHRDDEDLERKLTVLEQKMIAIARSRETEQQALEARRELDDQLRPYRRKMAAEQLAMLERQFLDRKLLDREQLPRLSLFYLG